MGSSGRHRRDHRAKHLPLGLAAALVLAVGGALAITFLAAGASSPPARAGAAAVPAGPAGSAPRPGVPRRASRGRIRLPLVAPARRHRSPRSPREHTATPRAGRVRAAGACEASFYEKGPLTADGGTYDPEALTAAHRTLPMGARVRVTNVRNDLSVIVRINDRGPFVPGRCLDLSTAAMRVIGGTGAGVVPVRYEVLSA